MKRAVQTILVLSLLTTGLIPAQARKMMGDNLSDMIIQGENRLSVHPGVDEVRWSVNVYRDIPDLVRENSWISQFQPPSIQTPPVALPERSRSVKTASPWLERIFEPPVLTLAFKAASGLGGLIAGIALDVIHFPTDLASRAPGQPIPVEVLDKLALISGPLPALFAMVSPLFLLGYHLTRKRHAQIIADLDQRKADKAVLAPGTP